MTMSAREENLWRFSILSRCQACTFQQQGCEAVGSGITHTLRNLPGRQIGFCPKALCMIKLTLLNIVCYQAAIDPSKYEL